MLNYEYTPENVIIRDKNDLKNNKNFWKNYFRNFRF